jgi:hypothetical protein
MNKCVICSAVKDIDLYLPKIIRNMHAIGKLFCDYQIVFFYDVSSDGTGNLLQDYARDDKKISFINNPTPLHNVPKTYKIAHARNSLLDYIRIHHSDYEFFAMMDADEICTHPANTEILEKYLHRSDWDGLTFNKPFYYDLWALGMKHLPFSVWHFKQPNTYQIYLDQINYMIDNCPKDEVVSVFSAFNGFGLYRSDKFLNSRYDGKPRLDLIPDFLISENVQTAGKVGNFHWDPSVPQDCEHRAFHIYATINNGANVVIAPEILFPNDPEFAD